MRCPFCFGCVRSVLFGCSAILFALSTAAALTFLLFRCFFARCSLLPRSPGAPLTVLGYTFAIRIAVIPPFESLLVGNQPLNSGKSTINGGLLLRKVSELMRASSRHLSDLGFCRGSFSGGSSRCLEGAGLGVLTTIYRRLACIWPRFFNKWPLYDALGQGSDHRCGPCCAGIREILKRGITPGPGRLGLVERRAKASVGA